MQMSLAEREMYILNDLSISRYHKKQLHDGVLSSSQGDMLGSEQQICIPASTG